MCTFYLVTLIWMPVVPKFSLMAFTCGPSQIIISHNSMSSRNNGFESQSTKLLLYSYADHVQIELVSWTLCTRPKVVNNIKYERYWTERKRMIIISYDNSNCDINSFEWWYFGHVTMGVSWVEFCWTHIDSSLSLLTPLNQLPSLQLSWFDVGYYTACIVVHQHCGVAIQTNRIKGEHDELRNRHINL